MKNLCSSLMLLACIAILSCKKDNAYDSTGTIFSIDGRKCASPCCGGWYIKIEKDTFRFLSLPQSDWDISKESLPIKVNLNWTKMSDDCAKDLISISKIEKVN